MLRRLLLVPALIPAALLAVDQPVQLAKAAPYTHLIDKVIPAYGVTHDLPYRALSNLDDIAAAVVAVTGDIELRAMGVGLSRPATVAAITEKPKDAPAAPPAPTDEAKLEGLFTVLAQRTAAIGNTTETENRQIDASYTRLSRALTTLGMLGISKDAAARIQAAQSAAKTAADQAATAAAASAKAKAEAQAAAAAAPKPEPLPELQTPAEPLPALEEAPTAVEAPPIEIPAMETPMVEAPTGDAPVIEAPAVEVPAVEIPEAEAPAVEVPEAEVPAAEAPAVEAPAEPAPDVVPEAPAPVVPAGDLPAL